MEKTQCLQQLIYSIVQKRLKENPDQVNGDYFWGKEENEMCWASKANILKPKKTQNQKHYQTLTWLQLSVMGNFTL